MSNVRTHTRKELVAESLGTLITLAVLWSSLYAVLWAMAETAEAQEVECSSTDHLEWQKCMTEKTKLPDNPCNELTGDEFYRCMSDEEANNRIVTDADGAKCLYRGFDIIRAKCKVAIDPAVAKLLVHENGQTFKEHWEEAARNICRRDLADLEYAYGWYRDNHGETHGATQIYMYRLVLKRLYCKQFGVE